MSCSIHRLPAAVASTVYPGQAVEVRLYESGGIWSCKIGTVMFGMQPDGTEKIAQMDLVRLAMPRRIYTQSHADYIIEILEELAKIKTQPSGFEITKQPKLMRHLPGTSNHCRCAMTQIERQYRRSPPQSIERYNRQADHRQQTPRHDKIYDFVGLCRQIQLADLHPCIQPQQMDWDPHGVIDQQL